MFTAPAYSPEAVVIGTLLREPTRLSMVLRDLTPDDFTEPSAIAAITIMQALVTEGIPVDFFAVQQRMPQIDMAKQLSHWMADASMTDLASAIRDILRRSGERRCRAGFQQLMLQLDRLPAEDVSARLIQLATELEHQLEPRYPSNLTTVPSGIKKLDDTFGGGWPVDSLIVINGASGIGRSTLLQALLHHSVAQHKKPALLALSDESLTAAQRRGAEQPLVRLVPDVGTTAAILLQSRLGHQGLPFGLIGLDSVHGLDGGSPDARTWRHLMTRLGCPLLVVTLGEKSSWGGLHTAADIIIQVNKHDEHKYHLTRNRYGAPDLKLSLADIPLKQTV